MTRTEPAKPRTADEIEELARRIDRLSISRRDPHAFFEERSEIAQEMRRLAVDVRDQM